MKKDLPSSTENSLKEVFKSLNDWVNNSALDGSVEAWRERLSTESNEHYRTSWCLRNLAKRDRPAAVNVATELNSWGLFSDDQYRQELIRVIDTLIRFPNEGELEEYLQSISIPLGEVHDEFLYKQAFLGEDYILSRGTAIRFDAETSVYPNRHDKLMQKLTSSSSLKSATFKEVAPREDDRSAKYVLQAFIDGKKYETNARNFGDWYDHETVVTFLNEISSDQGLNEVYVLLHTGDQTACVWLTDPNVLATLLDEGLIKLLEKYQPL